MIQLLNLKKWGFRAGFVFIEGSDETDQLWYLSPLAQLVGEYSPTSRALHCQTADPPHSTLGVVGFQTVFQKDIEREMKLTKEEKNYTGMQIMGGANIKE